MGGTRLRTSATWAALANGTAGHAHDCDDTSFALMGHPSVPLLATLLACGEAEMVDGGALALGYVIGFEIDTALGYWRLSVRPVTCTAAPESTINWLASRPLSGRLTICS